MLGLIGMEELNRIFDHQRDRSNDFHGRFMGTYTRAMSTYKQRSCFFSPYKDGSEFVGELSATVIYPLRFAVLSVGSLLAIPLSIAIGSISLFIAVGADLLGFKEPCRAMLDLVADSFVFSGAAALTTIAAVSLVFLSFFNSVASILARSLATLHSLSTDNIKAIEEYSPQMGH